MKDRFGRPEKEDSEDISDGLVLLDSSATAGHGRARDTRQRLGRTLERFGWKRWGPSGLTHTAIGKFLTAVILS